MALETNTVYNLLLELASEQLDKVTSKVVDESWFDTLIGELHDRVVAAELEDDLLNSALTSIDLLKENKDVLVGLGTHAFKLFVFQICSGKCDEAVDTYVSALSNAEDLIALMNANADGIIKAKKELDALHAKGKKLTIDLLTVGLRYLIPFLLSLV